MDAASGLPDDAIEYAIYRTRLLAKIDRGLTQAAVGDTLSQNEVRGRVSPFLTSGGQIGRDG
jgi:hypothetical protein